MNDIRHHAVMPAEARPENQPATVATGDVTLEQQMTDLGLSNDTRRFLRNLHLAEKQINDAFNKARQGGELEERVSEVYRDLYGAGCAVRASR